MHIRCSCGTMHYNVSDNLSGDQVYRCRCGTALTGVLTLEPPGYHDEISNKIKTNVLIGRLRTFTTEELLDEVKRRLSDAK